MRTPDDIDCENEFLRHFASVYEQLGPMLPGSDGKLGHMAEGGEFENAWHRGDGPSLSSHLWRTLGAELQESRGDADLTAHSEPGGAQLVSGDDSVGGMQG